MHGVRWDGHHGVMPVQSIAPPLTGRALTSQHWDNLTFLHWPVDPAAIATVLPARYAP